MASLRTSVLGSVLLLTAVVLAPGCDDDPAPDTDGEAGAGGAGSLACDEIGSLCHDAEDSELGHECHEVGHTGDGEACLARYDECINFCTAFLAGGAGGQSHGHGGEGHGGEGHAHAGEGHGGAAHGGASHGGASHGGVGGQ